MPTLSPGIGSQAGGLGEEDRLADRGADDRLDHARRPVAIAETEEGAHAEVEADVEHVQPDAPPGALGFPGERDAALGVGDAGADRRLGIELVLVDRRREQGHRAEPDERRADPADEVDVHAAGVKDRDERGLDDRGAGEREPPAPFPDA